MKRLWGITVAPRIPTADHGISTRRGLRTRALTGIEATRLEDVLGREVALEGITPVHIDLRDNDGHANEDRNNLYWEISTLVSLGDGNVPSPR